MVEGDFRTTSIPAVAIYLLDFQPAIRISRQQQRQSSSRVTRPGVAGRRRKRILSSTTVLTTARAYSCARLPPVAYNAPAHCLRMGVCSRLIVCGHQSRAATCNAFRILLTHLASTRCSPLSSYRHASACCWRISLPATGASRWRVALATEGIGFSLLFSLSVGGRDSFSLLSACMLPSYLTTAFHW